MQLKRELGLFTAVMVVMASMIGTGLFITTGIVLDNTGNSLVVLILWGIGGIVAITGTLCYAELATIWPYVGGEYIYLKKTFGLLPSFLTGWVSLVVGFSAAMAVSTIALFKYLERFFIDFEPSITVIISEPLTRSLISAFLVIALGSIHIFGLKFGSRVQNLFTVLKVTIVISLIVFGIYMIDWGLSDRLTYSVGTKAPSFSVMGLSLLIIMFAYSGWNGAVYIAGEIKNPNTNLPKALLYGTLLTSILYIIVNIVFIMSASGSSIKGVEAIGEVATKSLFGEGVSKLYNLGIILILISSIAVQLMIAPRVYYAMAKDKVLFKSIATIHPRFGTPAFAIITQIILTVIYVSIGEDIDALMSYTGFALGIFPLLTVIGLMYLRVKYPDIERPYKVPLYPLTPIIFISLTIYMMLSSLIERWRTSLFAIGVIILGIVIFYIWKFFIIKSQSKHNTSE